jgi:hypothetical protein
VIGQLSGGQVSESELMRTLASEPGTGEEQQG